MEKSKRSFIFNFLITALVVNHVTCSVLYHLPKNPLYNLYGSYVHKYVDSFFNQNWRLFSPEPPTVRNRILVRCKTRDNWTSWIDPSQKVLAQHHKTRLLGKGKVVYIFRNIARELILKSRSIVRASGCTIKGNCHQAQKIIENLNIWKIAKKLTTFTCLKYNPSTKKAQFSIGVEQIRSYSQRESAGTWKSLSTFPFEEFEIQ